MVGVSFIFSDSFAHSRLLIVSPAVLIEQSHSRYIKYLYYFEEGGVSFPYWDTFLFLHLIMNITRVSLGSLVSRWSELTEGHFEHTWRYLPGTADKERNKRAKTKLTFNFPWKLREKQSDGGGGSLQTHSGELHTKQLIPLDLSDITKLATSLNLQIKPQSWELINVSDTFLISNLG